MTMDRALVEIGSSFDFLLSVTPTNLDAAWDEYRATGLEPALAYPPIAINLGETRARLEALEDSSPLAELLEAKRRELVLQLDLLAARGSKAFLSRSIALFGEVQPSLVAEARAILATTTEAFAHPTGPRCSAEDFAELAEAELARYRTIVPDLASRVFIRADATSLVVSHGHVLVPAKLDLPRRRTAALLAHELGTHVLTYANGLRQPLAILAIGLAGYEALQEGLATIAEFFAGGLDRERLRLIAARVIAVRRLVEGARFETVMAELVDQHGFAPRVAFGIVVRVFRGGGLTKDAIYLEGVVRLLDLLRSAPLDPLFVGKLGFAQVDLVDAMLRDGRLTAPALRPSWAEGSERLDRIRAGLRPIDLVEEVP
jgi:uncharacterized protein (TIGR02421 family)